MQVSNAKTMATFWPVHLSDLWALAKPKITFMAVLVALGGYLHGGHTVLSVDSVLIILAIGLLVSGSGALNMYLERELDKKMIRTAQRPLPAGRMHPWWAILCGGLWSLLALVMIWFLSGDLNAILGALALFTYVCLYTPLKQCSWWSLIVGSVPGAMPVVLGYVANSGLLDHKALALFLWAFLWQIPHFLAISLFRESDYVNAGLKVLSHEKSKDLAKWMVLATSWLLVLSTVFLFLSGVFNLWFSVLALVVGTHFLYLCHKGFYQDKLDLWAKRAFKASLIYQSLLFILVITAAFF